MRLARGAARWIVIACAAPVAAALHSPVAALAAFAVPVGVAAFFRDPDREPDGDGVVSPADGKVSVVREDDGRLRVGVFMNIHNVHVNRAPVSGTVEAVEHHDGGHLPAFTKESERNERVVTRLDCRTDGDTYEVVQIAGTVARRVTAYVGEGEGVERGERIGVIAFGSRVDTVFPPSYEAEDLQVDEGDRVRAGTTVLAPYTDER